MKNRIEELINDLRSVRGNACVSIVLRMELAYPENQQNAIRLKNIAKKIVSDLNQKYDAQIARAITDELKKVEDKADWINTETAMVIYVGPDFHTIIDLPLSVEDSYLIDDKFDLSPLENYVNKSKSYYVLLLSKGGTRLFEGENNKLTERTDGQFPIIFENEYQQSKKVDYRFKKEESSVNQARLQSFFRDVHKKFKAQVKNDKTPVVLLGVQKHLSSYREVADHSLIEKEISGNYDQHSVNEISKIVWPLVKEDWDEILSLS